MGKNAIFSASFSPCGTQLFVRVLFSKLFACLQTLHGTRCVRAACSLQLVRRNCNCVLLFLSLAMVLSFQLYVATVYIDCFVNFSIEFSAVYLHTGLPTTIQQSMHEYTVEILYHFRGSHSKLRFAFEVIVQLCL